MLATETGLGPLEVEPIGLLVRVGLSVRGIVDSGRMLVGVPLLDRVARGAKSGRLPVQFR